MEQKKMTIELWTDVMCPYCYIGERNFESVLHNFPHKDELDIIVRTYQLDNSLPLEEPQGDAYQHLAAEAGISLDKAHAQIASIVEMAKSVGLAYDYEHLQVVSTYRALCFVQLAQTRGKGLAAQEILSRIYFEEGGNVGLIATLEKVAEELGFTAADVQAALNEPQYAEKIREDIAEAERINLDFIPYFRFNGKHTISGIIPVEKLAEALEKSFKEWKEGTPLDEDFEIPQGSGCDLNGHCH